MKTLVKLPFKIFAIPFIVAFTILGAAMKFFAWLSGSFLAVIAALLGIGGAVLLFKGDISAGIAVLILAFLTSPFGVPAIAGAIAGLIDGVNDSLKYFVTA
jgi:hypothetical protein